LDAPLDVFYPAARPLGTQRARWWRDSFGEMVAGYAHTWLGMLSPSLRHGSFAFAALSFLIRCFVWLIPISWASLPNVHVDATPSSNQCPLLLWSHGLTGTAEEHRLFASAMAARGFVVALVHHTDGSSSRVQTTGGNTLLYAHPDFKDYDRSIREKQVRVREAEVWQARQLLVAGELKGIRINPAAVFIGGFSYGAATAMQCLVTQPGKYAGAVLWDGWFFINMPKIQVQMKFPREAHAAACIQAPTLFIGSSQFDSFEGLREATQELQGKCQPEAEVVVVERTNHGDFADSSWWLPGPVLRAFKLSLSNDPCGVYTRIVTDTADFLERHTPR